MRILIIVPRGERLGGAESMLQTVLHGASDSAHELELVFLEPGPWPQELLEQGFHVSVIAAGRLRQAHRWLAAIVRLAHTLRRRRPDLIMNWSAKAQLYGAPAAVLAGMSGRVIWWQHMIPSREGWLDRCATLLPAKAVACTSTAAARMQATLVPRRPTFVVMPGASPPGAGAGELSLTFPADVPIVGLVGRLQPWKGQDRLLRAQAILHERGHRLHTLIVGGDAYGLSSDYAASLPELASSLGLRDSTTLTGQVQDAGPYIDRMDILLNASDPEPFGIVLLEAMARGVAVVAVDAGGPGEFISHTQTGVLASGGEPVALADALEVLLVSPSLRARIALAGQQLYAEEFTDVAMCERLFRALESQAGLSSQR
jgi:glycosyltransferase involved in cell wall biosynthesis